MYADWPDFRGPVAISVGFDASWASTGHTQVTHSWWFEELENSMYI